MDQVKTATTRLRRTFQYPADDDDADSTSSQPEALDEEGEDAPSFYRGFADLGEVLGGICALLFSWVWPEQEHLIERYAAENASRNAQFRLVLLVIPLLAAVPYLISFITRPAAVLLAMLGLTSLLSSALLVYRQAPAVTGITPLDAWVRGEDVRAAATRETDRLLARRARGGPLSGAAFADSPLDTYLPYLNLILATVLVLMGLVAGPRTSEFGFVGMGNWPALVYVNNLVAKSIMGSVDPERSLSALKYRYKGA